MICNTIFDKYSLECVFASHVFEIHSTIYSLVFHHELLRRLLKFPNKCHCPVGLDHHCHDYKFQLQCKPDAVLAAEFAFSPMRYFCVPFFASNVLNMPMRIVFATNTFHYLTNRMNDCDVYAFDFF